MKIAYQLAQQMGNVVLTPPWIETPAECARIVSLVEERAMGRVMEAWSHIAADAYDENVLAEGFVRGFSELAHDSDCAPGVEPASQRMNVLLRLWSGCISAAKMIAQSTRSGPNTSAMRANAFVAIDRVARADAIYHAGVVAAPTFKRMRDQPYSFEGVPPNSPVRSRPA